MSNVVLGRVLDETFAPEVRRDLTAVAAARTTSNAAYRFVAPFIATVARGLHVTVADIGVAIAVSELAGLASPLVGRFVDRLGPRRAVTIGLIGVFAGTALAAGSQGVAMLAVALVILSQGNITFYIGVGAWIAMHVPFERRGRVTGLIEVSWAFGLLIGVSSMGLVTAASNWRLGYASAAVAVIVVGAFVVQRISVASTGDLRPHGERPHGHGRLVPRGWMVLFAGFVMTAASHALFVTFGSWLEDDYGFSPARLSAVSFLLGAAELMATLSVARFTDRWGKRQSVAAGGLLMIPAAAGIALWHGHLGIGLALLALAVLGFEFAIVSAISLGTNLVPGFPARGLGLLIGIDTVGRSLMSIPATRLYTNHGIAWPATVSAMLATIGVVFMLLSARVPPA